ncbi:restriction endonuclease [Duganella vulcania]|uniref:Restriction endonuclease n=1 Tax=Duganella vulcania TaxID=2692166 RepID=A0A845GGM5_9BURK|nr:restriction endonuclease [Duganella vulcania]MYM92545.1 restriction endonuclease [Duganella vulcania]
MSKRSNFLSDLIGAPWWLGVTLAFFVWLFFAHLIDFVHIPGADVNPFLRMFDGALHQPGLRDVSWLFVAVCLVGSLGSLVRLLLRGRLFDAQTDRGSIQKLDWRQFERLVAEAYARQGFRVGENGQGGADGGVDLYLHRDGQKTIVQCKHWRSTRVGSPVVREMYGLMQHEGASAVKIVTSGHFTEDARLFARDKPIDLVDGQRLHKLIGELQRGRQDEPSTEALATQSPACPQCGGSMVERTNRRTHERFLGCHNYPRCRGTLQVQ